MAEIYVFGGCNGSGKTTLATAFLSSLSGVEFVNADIIAAELNPNDVDSVAIQASRLMLERINTLSRQGTDFAFETTLAARTVLVSIPLRLTPTRGLTANPTYAIQR